MLHQTKKIHKINYILDMIKTAHENNQVWNEEKLISEVCITFGAARRYVIEILHDLANTKRIVRDIGEVFTPEQYKKVRAQAVTDEQINEEAEKILEDL